MLLEPGVPLESWDRRESLALRDRRALKGNGVSGALEVIRETEERPVKEDATAHREYQENREKLVRTGSRASQGLLVFEANQATQEILE